MPKYLPKFTDKYYVCFCDSPLWYLQWLPRNRRHVFLMYQQDGLWCVVNPLHTHLHITWEPVELYAHPVDYYPCDIIALDVRVRHRQRWPSLFSCVEVVRAVIGLQGWYLTPVGLWKHLIKIGGKVEQRI